MGQTPQPFETASLHPLWRAARLVGDEVERRADADETDVGTASGERVGEKLLLRRAQRDEANPGVTGGDAARQRETVKLLFRRAGRRRLRPDDSQAGIAPSQCGDRRGLRVLAGTDEVERDATARGDFAKRFDQIRAGRAFDRALLLRRGAIGQPRHRPAVGGDEIRSPIGRAKLAAPAELDDMIEVEGEQGEASAVLRPVDDFGDRLGERINIDAHAGDGNSTIGFDRLRGNAPTHLSAPR